MHNINPIYSVAIKHFGEDNQLLKCVEEMAELQQAIIKFQLSSEISASNNQSLLFNLIEEIVDVEIMLHQIKTIFNSETEIEIYNRYKSKKIEKLQNLIAIK